MTDKLKDLLNRAARWPEEAQNEAVDALREIEEEFVIGPETVQEVEEARAQAEEDQGPSMAEVKNRLGL